MPYTFDRELVQEILAQLFRTISIILKRFEPVSSPEYFSNTPEGMEKLDSICMLLIVIGESLKNVDKITENRLLKNYPEIDWKGAKGMRDIISHHYFDIDAEQIFGVCSNKLKPILNTIKRMQAELQK